MIAEELENVGTDGLRVVDGLGFDGEQELEDAGGDEADEEAAVVDDDVLRGRVSWGFTCV